MIRSIKLSNFQAIVDCKNRFYTSKETFLPVTGEFVSGNTYGFYSDFGCGSWGVVTCLGGRTPPNYDGVMIVDCESEIIHNLLSLSCFLPETEFDRLVFLDSACATPRQYIENALMISASPFTEYELKKQFNLSDARYDRPLAQASGEIWNISMAVNFALGKDIFCFPWLNAMDISRFRIACELGIIDFLTAMGKIVLVPSSQDKILRKYCDHVLHFQKDKIVFR